jgi:ech hydrogenase subunit C
MSLIETARKKSPWLLHVNCGGCNGCELELVSCLTPRYDVTRFGVENTDNPKHADVMVVIGPVTKKYEPIIRNLYAQMPDPKVIMAVGTCTSTGGVYQGCYGHCGALDKVLPVDVYVPGCNVRPEAIIDGLVMALDILNEKEREILSKKTKGEA